MFCGHTLNEHQFIGRTVFPARGGIDAPEFAGLQCLPDFTEGGPVVFGFDDKISVAGDVVGIGTDVFRHGFGGFRFQFRPDGR